MSFSGDLDTIIDQLARSGSRALGQLISKTKANYDLDYKSFTKLFNACVVPVLDYGSGSWGTGSECKKIDDVQNWAI